MDPVSMVMGALAAGVAEGLGEAASTAVRDSYERLKAALRARFHGRPAAEVALAEYELDADAWSPALTKELASSNVAAAPEVLAFAEALLQLVDPVGASEGKYKVDASAAQGVQIGDGNTQHNTFGP